ncbi:MAG TPA: NAD-dependent epimerase/dehydratase family protein [Chloroflexi bacterium]|nr:NAD-dependent epimerase/dehydratase family protein [Chloroflexota bacterium]
MSSIFITGFPGFLGSRLVARLLDVYAPEVALHCLVQPAYRSLAERRVAQLVGRKRAHAGRIRLHDGDVTRARLGLGNVYQELAGDVQEIFHLAAIYDLGAKRAAALAVNVEGTRHVLRFAGDCAPRLRRFHHVSTCYVSGNYHGLFGEQDLDKGQSFHNHYEETKFLAEVEVQRRMRQGLPTSIYRPSIVVGDSATGATQKYDGIYYLIHWLLRQPRIAILPIVGDGSRYELNFAPRDFVVEAIIHLSKLDVSQGCVYHLCDPAPLIIDDIIRLIGQATRRRIVCVPLPRIVIQGSKHLPFIQRITRIEPAALDYFTHPTRYTCHNALAHLAGSGIYCPSFASYVDNLVGFTRAHPQIPARAMA